jgi:predicted phosphate transport protein (TIGR00153 family)
MSKKKEDKYFNAFIEMSSYSCKAARFLRDILGDYNPDNLDISIEKMHAIEHDADVSKHTMTRLLAKEFVTPLEREDILELASMIDTVTDKTEDVLLRLYMFNIREIREDAITLADMLVKCVESMKEALEEFHNFKKSKTLNEKIIEINYLEEEGDRLYTHAVRNVFTQEGIEGIEAAAWNQVFHYIEDVFDACEDVADVIEGVMMKNS